jgi:YbbR domain-containing protein
MPRRWWRPSPTASEPDEVPDKIAILLSNLRLKLLAIGFAVALWSVVAYSANPTQSHNYKITIDRPTLPAGLVIVGDLPQVTVTVIGTSENLRTFDAQLRSNPSMLHVSANFAGTSVGKKNILIHVNNPDPAISIDAPKTVTVTIDELASSTQPVSIERVKALAPGFHEQANATTVTPPNVRIDGPKSLLTGARAVVLVDLDSLQAPGFNQPYIVQVWDTNKRTIKGVTLTPPQVTVKMVIQADALTVPKPVGWTLTGQPAAGYRVANVQIAPLEVLATGLQNTLTGLLLLATDPVDISNATSDIVRTVTIRPPAGVEVAQKTAQVRVFIARSAQVSPSPGP